MTGNRGGRDRVTDRPAWVGSVGVVILVVLAGCTGLAGVDPGDATSTAPPSTDAPTTTGPTAADPGDGAAGETPRTAEPLPPGDPPGGVERLADSAVTIRGEGADEMGYGAAVGDVNDDGTPDVVVGAPFHNASGPRSGAVFVYFGPVRPDELSVEDADVRLAGEAGGDWAGNSIAVADVSGDGADDLVVGAPRNREGGDVAGAVYVVHGGGGLEGARSLADAEAKLVGATPESFAGYSVAAANLTGGPAADVLVGAPRASVSGPESGAVYLVDGRDLAATRSLADADATVAGEGADDRAGRAVSIPGDVDGDGNRDALVGARRADGGANRSGAAYLLPGGSVDDWSSLADAAVTFEGVGSNDDAGYDVAGGDVNGDGYADVLVGAPRNDAGGGTAGAVHVVHGGPDLPTTVGLDDADATLLGAPGDHAGHSVGAVGDVTCDGSDDVLVGAPWNDTGGDNAGAAYLVVGGTTSEASLQDATATYVGATIGAQVGRVDALVGIPGEGTNGLVIGAPFGERSASAHVVYTTCGGAGG